MGVRDLVKDFRTPKRHPGLLGSLRTLFTSEQTVNRAVGSVSFEGFQNESAPNVTATADGDGVGDSDVSVLFTNWTLSDAYYTIEYICNDHPPSLSLSHSRYRQRPPRASHSHSRYRQRPHPRRP